MENVVLDTEERANWNRRASCLRMPCAPWHLTQQEGSIGIPGCTRHDWVAEAVHIHTCCLRIERRPEPESQIEEVCVSLHRHSEECDQRLILQQRADVRQHRPRGDPWIPHVRREVAVEAL